MKIQACNALGRFAPRGFTLVELLVVITVVAVLMNILLPAMTAAREQAKITICESQERQMGIGMGCYTNDFAEAIAYSYPANYVDQTQGYAQTRFSGYVVCGWGDPADTAITHQTQNHGMWVQMGYVGSQALMCPDQTLSFNNTYANSYWGNSTKFMKSWNGKAKSDDGAINYAGSGVMSTYAFNGGLTRTLWYAGGGKPWALNGGGYQTVIDPWKVGFMKSNWPILADLREAGAWGYGGSVISANHYASGYNILYTDGSVLWTKLQSRPDLSDVVNNYTSAVTTNSPMNTTWSNFISLR